MDPQTQVASLPQIGNFYRQKLRRLGIETVEDLIYYFPFRYDDFSKIELAQNINPGEKVSIQGTVWQIKNIRTRSGKFITTATVADQSGIVEVIWFNQPYLTKTLKAGTPVSLSGKVDTSGSRPKLMSPSWEILRVAQQAGPPTARSESIENEARIELGKRALAGGKVVTGPTETLHTGRLVPIYPKTEGVSSKWLRTKIAQTLKPYLKAQKDFLPKAIALRQKLISLEEALSKIHFPQNWEDIKKASTRLAFDELFLIQLTQSLRKKEWQTSKKAPVIKVDNKKLTEVIQNLPFTLTQAQIRAIKEILADLAKPTPQNRLLEGDVGSGKTVVAALAAYATILNGFDVLFAAPTEILAFQHQKTLNKILSSQNIKIGIWTGSKKENSHLTCGTHALLKTFQPKRQVGLIIIDEQHRFGVAQRAKLFVDQTKDFTPHFLTMTATPIPRTLALTLYRDLDLSVLDEMPLGRQQISTHVVPNIKRNDAYKFIEKQIDSKRQAFIITPFVEPSETMISVRSATEEFKKLKTKFNKKVKLGLLHGRLKSKEKEQIIEKFKAAKIDILVTTPVVEVGIDVPNATVMLIESADRFGLAQLHQLRGRVGRGEHKSYCLLFTDSQAPPSLKRLKSMEKIHVGFELAEIDLKMRGAGEIFGLKQSGFISLKIADPTDAKAIAKAQEEANNILESDPTLSKHPLLTQKLNQAKLEYIQPN